MAFFNEQCKEIEESNRMGKTSDLVNKIGDIKGIFHAWMGIFASGGQSIRVSASASVLPMNTQD